MKTVYADIGGIRHVIEPCRHVIPAVFGGRSGQQLGGGQPSVSGRQEIGVPAFVIPDYGRKGFRKRGQVGVVGKEPGGKFLGGLPWNLYFAAFFRGDQRRSASVKTKLPVQRSPEKFRTGRIIILPLLHGSHHQGVHGHQHMEKGLVPAAVQAGCSGGSVRFRGTFRSGGVSCSGGAFRFSFISCFRIASRFRRS